MTRKDDQPSATDWEQMARRLGALDEDGRERGSSTLARRAIEELLGPETCRSAVDYYVAGKPGSELARAVLWQLRPWSAIQRCYEIYSEDTDPDRRTFAVELLRVVADARVLKWIGEFLADPSPDIQTWGAGVIDQLLFSDLVDPDDCHEILDAMAHHPNEKVREQYDFIRSFLAERQGPHAGQNETATAADQEPKCDS